MPCTTRLSVLCQAFLAERILGQLPAAGVHTSDELNDDGAAICNTAIPFTCLMIPLNGRCMPTFSAADVQAFREAFDELDEDGSGALSFSELANMIRSLGTYATTGDVEAMLWEIDIDSSHSIGYDEFVKFLTYAFIDTRQLGGCGCGYG